MIGALRRFLPEFLRTDPPLSRQQRRAIWAISHCRTPALGGRSFVCDRCGEVHFAFHSCNHKACPQCGHEATKRWVRRELDKLVGAPYFLVTFTLPSELRSCFLGRFAKEAAAMLDRREQRKRDQELGLVPFAIKLDSELVRKLHALAQQRQVGLNDVVGELLEIGLKAK